MATQRLLLFLVLLVSLVIGVLAGMAVFGPNEAETPANVTDRPPADQNAEEIVIYFSKSRGSENVTEAVVRKVPPAREAHAIDFALEQLLSGPNQQESVQGYFSEIPKGTRLLGVVHKPEELRVNLSRQFTSGGGSTSMQQRLAELTKTIRAVEKEIPVYVDVEGEQLEVLGGEGLIVDEPINQGGDEVR